MEASVAGSGIGGLGRLVADDLTADAGFNHFNLAATIEEGLHLGFQRGGCFNSSGCFLLGSSTSVGHAGLRSET